MRWSARLTGVSQAYARSLRSRLGAAETIVQTLTARDVGYDGSALKQQIVNSRAFKSAVVVDRDGLLAGGDADPAADAGPAGLAGGRADRRPARVPRRASSPPFSWPAP